MRVTCLKMADEQMYPLIQGIVIPSNRAHNVCKRLGLMVIVIVIVVLRADVPSDSSARTQIADSQDTHIRRYTHAIHTMAHAIHTMVMGLAIAAILMAKA